MSSTELSKPIQLVRSVPDEVRDQLARLTVVRTMADSGYSHEAIAEMLDMLGLLPGQEGERGLSGTSLTHRPGEGACGPRSKMSRVYVPN